MAHKQAALKDIRQTKKRAKRNKNVKEHLAYLKKQTQKAVEKKDAARAEDFYKKLVKSVDKAAKRNIVKKNTANRRKSRLAKKINTLKKTA
ncbi:30S ribosomal protein S20 [Candidatus Uhrbacteria bacterium]|nr:30S ribosomal protein S20 [Candidatus Uhrbacteria bacterium]